MGETRTQPMASLHAIIRKTQGTAGGGACYMSLASHISHMAWWIGASGYALVDPRGRKYWVPRMGSLRRRSSSWRSPWRSTKSISLVLTTRRSDEV